MNLHKQIKNLFDQKKVTPEAITKFTETGWEMINEINNSNPGVVLDLGCGNNIYKGKINNLIGVDILDNKLQDIYSPIESLPFKDNYADVILALGSVNFGSEDLIDAQLQEIKRVSKPGARIYFRVLSGHHLQPYFNWTDEILYKKSKKYSFEFLQESKTITRNRRSYHEHDNRTGYRDLKRLYCIWKVNK